MHTVSCDGTVDGIGVYSDARSESRLTSRDLVVSSVAIILLKLYKCQYRCGLLIDIVLAQQFASLYR